MKYKFTITLLSLIAVGFAFTTNANAITFTFQENGSNGAPPLGTSSTFTESGVSLTASGFLTSGAATDLFAKNLGGDEVGLGLTHDPSHQNEITTDDFIQLTLPTIPASTFNIVISGSVQSGESEQVFFTTTPGSTPNVLLTATLLGTITTSGGTVTVPATDQTGFIDITAGSGNVLLASAVVTPTVPDGGSAVALLGIALAGIEALRRTLRKK